MRREDYTMFNDGLHGLFTEDGLDGGDLIRENGAQIEEDLAF